MWCYTELCKTTIFSATHRCNIGTMLQPLETMMQRCVALKPSLWIVSCNPHTVCKVDLATSRAFERVARLWARSAIVRARSASEREARASESSCRVLPHQTRKPSERLWESLFVKVMLHETIRNVYFESNTAWQCWNNDATILNNVETML